MDEMHFAEDETVSPGSIALISEERGEELMPAVVRRTTDEGLVVVPISPDVHLATEWDLYLPAEPLGYQAIAQLWNFGSVLIEQVSEVVGEVGPVQAKELDALAKAARESARAPSELNVGPKVMDDQDPRLLGQADSAEGARPFWEPALSIAGAETIGQLVAHRRQALGLQPDDLEASIVADAGWVDELEGDRLNVRETLTPKELASLMKRLRVRASRRLGRISLWTIEGSAPRLARGGLDGPGADANAADYVQAMLAELDRST
ncbi:MAG: hypothetical protein JSS97_00885 [Actinobacteria bacterium]|nr:hypothetical protein [Actinomycetota bacterium]